MRQVQRSVTTCHTQMSKSIEVNDSCVARRLQIVLFYLLLASTLAISFPVVADISRYCPGGGKPCIDTCAPAGTPACGEGSPPPCTIGSVATCPLAVASPDFKGTVAKGIKTLSTTFRAHVEKLDSNGRCLLCTTVTFPDKITVNTIAAAVPILGLAYIGTPIEDVTSNLTVTSIYGIDLNPESSNLLMTGVNSAAPEFIPVSGETIIGNSGAEYGSIFMNEIPIEDLGSLLGAGFDLSPFAEGNPASDVYVFQTIVPTAEVTIPETASWACLSTAVALSGWLYVRRQRRRVN